ncbi:MAG: HNH endonuclease [Chelatococcus sp.]|nr:HNH endonuclease [Chelatococcus sp. YT9]MBX3560086.1 HNH endonuclease [Chelatococcus sp.]
MTTDQQRLNRKRQHDAKRRAEQPWRAWYSLPIWRHPQTGLRAHQLRRKPLCERCDQRGIITPADTVNHVKPHKGDWSLFIDPTNHQSVCKACHDSIVKAEEMRGYPIGNDVSGRPIDPSHHWNQD